MVMLKAFKRPWGFTVVELVIAIAVMGLISVLIFAAANQLNRTKRDNQRKADAARMLTAVRQYVNDNNGSMPTSNADLTAIVNNYILKQPGITFYPPGSTSNWNYGLVDTSSLVVGAGSTALYVGAPATCNGRVMASSVPVGSRQIAVEVWQETGTSGGTVATYCISQ